ncbi:MAG: hypothetical protein NTZ90_12105 [Proteobacteria bacterium]|nr:hypothetical protein [Pseudomonadota bacterium]
MVKSVDKPISSNWITTSTERNENFNLNAGMNLRKPSAMLSPFGCDQCWLVQLSSYRQEFTKN